MTQTTEDSFTSSDTGKATTTASAFTEIMAEEEKGAAGASTAPEEKQSLEEAAAPPELETKVDEARQGVTEASGKRSCENEKVARSSEVTGVTGPSASSSSGVTLVIADTAVGESDSAGGSGASSADVIAPSEIMDISASNHTDSSQFSKAPMCAICSEPCICYCKSCKKVCYCSKEHQKKHWKQHRPECYPVIVQVNSVFGSHLVVTRDVKRGEVILREKPLVTGPFLGFDVCDSESRRQSGNKERSRDTVPSSFPSACLTCHKILWEHDETKLSAFSGRNCSKCGWPVCCQDCEKNPVHADQECEIFAEYHVGPSALCDRDAQYLCVALLRILLDSKRRGASATTTDTTDHDANTRTASTTTTTTCNSNSKWTKLMEVVNKQMPMKDGLNSQLAEAKKATARFSDLITKSLGSIIHQEFSVTEAEIDQIVQTLRTSSFITDTDGNYINGFFGRTLSMNNNGDLGHYYYCRDAAVSIGQERNTDADDAKNNVSRYFRDKGKCLSLYHLASFLTSNCTPNASWVIQETLDFYLRASTPIKTGERITISFVDPLLGTWKRRERLWQEKYLSCSCTRCSDPTESCTFLSAIKCPSRKAEDGKNSGSGSECEGYILPTDPLAVTYTSWDSCRTSCFCELDAATQDGEVRTDSCCRCSCKLGCDENSSIPGFCSPHAALSPEKLCEMRSAEWKCNVCEMRQPWGFVRYSLQRIRESTLASSVKQISAQQDICFTTTPNFGGNGNNTMPEASKLHEQNEEERKVGGETREKQKCTDPLQSLELRVDKIDNFVRNVAHANHYDVLKMENELLTEISKLLEKGQMPFEEMEKWALKMMELCKKGLKVVNILCPGLSRERGYLLYFLQQSLVISLLFKTSRAMRIINSPAAGENDAITSVVSKESLSRDELMKKFQEVLLARKEVLEIFAISKDKSKEAKMLKAIQHDSIEIRLLKNYFKYHQNTAC